MTLIALCMNSKELQENFSDEEVCSRFHGAGFLPKLLPLAAAGDSWVMSASKAIREIKAGILDPKTLLVLQEDMCLEGLELIQLGAKPQLVFCLESPLYIPDFYDHINEIKSFYKRTLLFDGGTKPVYFPSFDQKLLDTFNAPKTEELCMISSNKQWWNHPKRFDSPSWCQSIRNELHTQRLVAIENHPNLHLYGPGWDVLEAYPVHFKHLHGRMGAQWKGIVSNKLETLARYRKAVCYENISYPGYVTEKGPHALLVGADLIYKGPEYFSVGKLKLEKYTHEAFAHTIMDLLLN